MSNNLLAINAFYTNVEMVDSVCQIPICFALRSELELKAENKRDILELEYV